MADAAFTTFTCPHCGNTIQVPEALLEFSCVYCGQRLTLEALMTEAQAQSSQVLPLLLEALPAMITGYPKTMQNLQPGKFPTYFEGYVAQHLPTLEMVDSILPQDQEGLAREVMQAVAQHLAATKTAATTASAHQDAAKFTLCLVTIPAIRQCAPSQGLPFSQALRQGWLEQFPKSDFQVTDYDTIAQGFQRKKLCFITTAVCGYLGKPDDCPELQQLRSFRDGWLRSQPQGPALIDAYYRLAPGIVTAIDLAGSPDTAYPALWQDHLQPCLAALQAGDNPLCLTLYTRMMDRLGRQYLT